MHIVIAIVVLFFYLYSQSFRRLINATLISLALAMLLGGLVGKVINSTAGIIIGIVTFLFSVSMLFKALRFMSQVIAQSGLKGVTKYTGERAKGEKHDKAIVDGGIEAFDAALSLCKSADNAAKFERSGLKVPSQNYSDVTVANFFHAVENSDVETLSAIKKELSPSELHVLINSEDEIQDRPLHVAVRKDSPDIIYWLLSNGADRELKNYWEHTALELAIKLRQEKCVERLSLSLEQSAV
ncbi:ankyrin repeat domain-containing protein [Alteromonas gilva]|uniref:Ankyrin repeat domain-containing protein n=1 Tax=Alteromonas gilva TaxID=2987522 RepID=A0ABT5L752_9ALTE|nr:ankyrin repeat domain-containing protein [Alteromonas gilva]MDC8832887.1 hypothetical protein [Alteromonas gilva]